MENEIITEALSIAQQSLKESHRDTAIAYLQLYFEELPREFVRGTTPNNLFAFGMERFAFLEENFEKDAIKVRISKRLPTVEFLETNFTVVEARLPDATFIVRTLKAFFRQRDIQIQMAVHPVVGVVHTRGTVGAIDGSAKQGDTTSHIYMHVSPIPEENWERFENVLQERLRTLEIVNADYQPSLDRLTEIRNSVAELRGSHPEPEVAECLELLDWLPDNNFIFMGYAFAPMGADKAGGDALQDAIGILREDAKQLGLRDTLAKLAGGRARREELYSFYRTDYLSVVKSEAQLRYVGVQAFAPDGTKTGEHFFLGLLSSNSLGEPNKRFPVVSGRMQQAMQQLELLPGTYSHKQVLAILNSMPCEELYYSTLPEILDQTEEIRSAEEADRTRVFVRRRPGARRISITCVLPRPLYSESVKAHASHYICKQLEVPRLREYLRSSTDEGPVRLHFYVGTYRPGVGDAELEALGEGVAKLLQTWDERLQARVYRRYRDRGDMASQSKYMAVSSISAADLWQKYMRAFPESYRRGQSPEIALEDIALAEKLMSESEVQVHMALVGEDDDEYSALRVVSPFNLLLNDIVPVLQNMSLRSSGRLSEKIRPAGCDPVYLTSFAVSGGKDGAAITDPQSLTRLSTIIQRVISGRLANDPLLGLGHLAGLSWRQIDLVMTYRNYFMQVFQGFTARSINETLLHHHQCTRLAVDYFQTKFQTGGDDEKTRLAGPLVEMEARYVDLLGNVDQIQEDVILRLFISIFQSTVRTNYYRPGRGEIISIKIHSESVSHMPRPCPLFEIYVHGPAVEGIHLRGGMVARGGLRHSDRIDDFRTEVHGLQSTQMTKNSVIVPVGSKGGFITRNLFSDRDEMEAEAKKQYENFISGLLDVTDNLDGDEVVPPPGVLRYDGDDPYLVVAADKGTAHRSDTANALSEQYGYWLDDAFASGGSAGYDHKAMGITARGAWVNVERHFRELGTNIQEESITVAGIGDMSGDVFGNGMLLNDKMKLIAAFNHRHIFVDPDPDPDSSFAERKRLFELPRSAWTDYDDALLSDGGGIYDRVAKSIPLSAQARERLGIEAESVSGPELIKAILALDVDLLWLGGIGTYVKATQEGDVEVGDTANDTVRIDASSLRCRVIGEGANLGVTPRARTEFLYAGGRCNTDFIDNSAGVDCSDHEVNMKILMALLARRGLINDREHRNEVLRSVEDEVGLACLQNNYLQSALITMEAMRSRRELESFLELISYLQERDLDRAAERVPPDELLREWFGTGRGIMRDVLASIIAFTKNDLYKNILASTIPDTPFFDRFLIAYFPGPIAEQYGEHLKDHRLRREIITTVVSNALVNQAGSTFLLQVAKESTAPLEETITRYFVCDALLDGGDLRKAIHALDNVVEADAQYAALLSLEDAIRDIVRWWNWNEQTWSVSTDTVAALKPDFRAAVAAVHDGLSAEARADVVARRDEMVAAGFPAAVAERIARVHLSRHAFSVISASRETGHSIAEVGKRFHHIAQSLRLDQLESILAAQPPGNQWEMRFHGILEREVAALRRQFTTAMLANGTSRPLEELLSRHGARIDRIGDSLNILSKQPGRERIPLFILLDDYRSMLA